MGPASQTGFHCSGDFFFSDHSLVLLGYISDHPGKVSSKTLSLMLGKDYKKHVSALLDAGLISKINYSTEIKRPNQYFLTDEGKKVAPSFASAVASVSNKSLKKRLEAFRGKDSLNAKKERALPGGIKAFFSRSNSYLKHKELEGIDFFRYGRRSYSRYSGTKKAERLLRHFLLADLDIRSCWLKMAAILACGEGAISPEAAREIILLNKDRVAEMMDISPEDAKGIINPFVCGATHQMMAGFRFQQFRDLVGKDFFKFLKRNAVWIAKMCESLETEVFYQAMAVMDDRTLGYHIHDGMEVYGAHRKAGEALISAFNQICKRNGIDHEFNFDEIFSIKFFKKGKEISELEYEAELEILKGTASGSLLCAGFEIPCGFIPQMEIGEGSRTEMFGLDPPKMKLGDNNLAISGENR